MNKKIKRTKFSTYSEMIDNLMQKNLSLGSKRLAIELLKSRGYYNLINRYKHEFYTDHDMYQEDTSIMDLYLFHRMEDDLRNILFRFTINFEQRFKEAMSYTLARDFGIYEADYLDPLKYRKNKRNKAISIMGEMCDIAFNTSNTPTEYYRKNYDSIPPWILLSNTSLGQARMWFSIFPTKSTDYVVSQLLPIHEYYSLTDADDLYEFKSSLIGFEELKKIKTDKEYDRIVRERFNLYIDLFKAMLNIIHVFRNILAHGNRLIHFTVKRSLNLKPLRRFANTDVFTDEEYYKAKLSKNDLFAFIVSLMILLDKYDSLYLLDQLKSWKERNSKDPMMELNFKKFLNSCNLPLDFIERLSHISTETVYQENNQRKLTDLGLYPKNKIFY